MGRNQLDAREIERSLFLRYHFSILLLLTSHYLQPDFYVFSQHVRVFNFTVKQSQVDDFNRFVLRSPASVAIPFKKHLKNNSDEAYLLFKAAEMAVEKYQRIPRNPHRLRQVVDIQKLTSNFDSETKTFRVQVVLQDTAAGCLMERNFIVTVRKRKKEVSLEISLRPKRSQEIENQVCDDLSTIAKCRKCGFNGICDKGDAEISPWLAFSLKTQRELQQDVPFNQLQMVGAHNAFNDRTDGYGIDDDCHWPPPYNECLDLANQEFSFTDLLDMGVRALEIDPWWCFDKIRMSHAYDEWYLGCAPWDREFKDGIKEIGLWVHKPENSREIVRLYFEDGATHTAGHDELINGPIKKYLGDKVLTPAEMKKFFPNRWPTVKEMIKINKTVFLATNGKYTHQGLFIHEGYWSEFTVNQFMSYPNCTYSKPHVTTRVYSDSTQYGPFWNGPKQTGVVLDYQKFMKCVVNYIGADQVNPQLLESAVFSWAHGEPRQPLTNASCIVLCAEDEKWHVEGCNELHYFACLKGTDEWILSKSSAIYTQPTCPVGYEFSIPHNGYEHQRLLKAMKRTDVWINFTPFIPLVI